MDSTQSRFLKTLTYSAAVIVTGWGVVEIFLRVNPFTAAYFKYAIFPGVALLAGFIACLGITLTDAIRSLPKTCIATVILVAAAALGTLFLFRDQANFWLFLLGICTTAIVILLCNANQLSRAASAKTTLLLAILSWVIFHFANSTKYLEDLFILQTPNESLKAAFLGQNIAPLFYIRQGGGDISYEMMLMLLIGSAALVALALDAFLYICGHAPNGDCQGKRLPRWMDTPVIIAGVVLGIVMIAIGTGRARQITIADIAQEELRQGGLEFSMSSLQDAIYLISPRSVELFRQARVDESDIRDALGAKGAFTGDDPLVKSILNRIDPDDLNCLEGANTNACDRIENFIELFADPGDAANPGDPSSLCRNLSRSIRLREGDGAPPRPLLSHALSGGYSAVAIELMKRCGGLDAALDVVPEPIQQAASSEDDSTAETRRRQNAIELSEAQRHIRAVIDPHLAVIDGLRVADGRWTANEAKRVHEMLCEKGIKPSSLFGSGSVDSALEKCTPGHDAAVKENPPYLGSETFGGRTITFSEETCNIEPALLKLEPDSWKTPIELNGKGHPSVWNYRSKLSIGAEEPKSALLQRQSRDDEFATRLVYETGRPSAIFSELRPLRWAPDQNDLLISGDLSDGAALGRARSEQRIYLQLGKKAEDFTVNSLSEDIVTLEKDQERQLEMSEFGTPFGKSRLALPDHGAIRMTGEAPVDLCIIFSDRSQQIPSKSKIIRRNSSIDFSTSVFPKGNYDLNIAALSLPNKEISFTLELFEKIDCRFVVDSSGDSRRDQKLIPIALVEPTDLSSNETEGNQLICAFSLEKLQQITAKATSTDDLVLEVKNKEGRSLINVDSGALNLDNQPVTEQLDLVLEKGDYNLIVRPFSGEFASRVLSASLSPSAPPPLVPVSDTPTPHEIKNEGRQLHLFEAEEGQRIKVELSGLSGDLDLNVLRNGVTLRSSTNVDRQDETVVFDTEQGLYQIEVRAYADSPYELTVSETNDEVTTQAPFGGDPNSLFDLPASPGLQ